MKKIVALVMAVSFCSALSATEIEKVTFKDRVKDYYETFKAKMPELSKKNFKIAGIATASVATVIAGSYGGYAGYKHLKNKNAEKVSE